MTTRVKFPGIAAPTQDPVQHANALRSIKEGIEMGQRLRGDPLDSFVRLRELVDAGIVTYVGGVLTFTGTVAVTAAGGGYPSQLGHAGI